MQYTEKLWRQQDRHKGDRWRLFRAIAESTAATTVFYPGSFVDISPSFVFKKVTYLDMDKRTPKFFADKEGLLEIVGEHRGAPENPEIDFLHGDYAKPLPFADESFDLLISLYAGFISEHCTRYLKKGGMLLVNSSHGDAAMASIDPRYELAGAVIARQKDYAAKTTDLHEYLIPKKPVEVTKELLHKTGRGIGYTKPAFAYLFKRIT
jgi:hypothetical protein